MNKNSEYDSDDNYTDNTNYEKFNRYKNTIKLLATTIFICLSSCIIFILIVIHFVLSWTISDICLSISKTSFLNIFTMCHLHSGNMDIYRYIKNLVLILPIQYIFSIIVIILVLVCIFIIIGLILIAITSICIIINLPCIVYIYMRFYNN